MDPAVRKHGCHSYIVAHDLVDADVLWVTEVWADQPTHLSWSEDLRQSGAWRPIYGLMAKMDDSIQTRPLGGIGL
ncbi:MAG: antibiotic biosynthesis monooxygenase [Brevundimonas sp.]|nr:antibiotic biosynthesis monooxygenase [Brevundimonas sp.]